MANTEKMRRVIWAARYDRSLRDEVGRSLWTELREWIRGLGFRHDVTSSFWDADHIVPLNRGGTNELSNLRTLCHPCHKSRKRHR